MDPIRSVSAAENPALATAVDSILRTQGARYIHIGTWALGLAVACGPVIAAVWCAITMAMGYVRGVAEARIARRTTKVGRADLRDLYPWIAAGVGMFWAAAPFMAWMSGGPIGHMLAVLMLSAGYLMVLTQFRGAPRSAIIVSAPYSAVFLVFVAQSWGTPWFAATLAGIPILVSALAFGLLHGLIAQNRIIGAQLAAERERARLALALDSARAVVWELDLDAGEILADDRLWDMMGRPETFEAAASGRFDGVDPEDRPQLEELFAVVRAEPTRRPVTYRIAHPERGEMWLHSVVASFADSSGRVVRMMVITFDVTERKQRDDALLRLRVERDAAEAANLAKSQFLANMSHELRTPLNAIIGYSELLSEDAADRADQSAQSDLAKVLSAARRLLALINDVLDLTKIEAGRLELEIGAVDVAALIQESIDTVRPAATANGNRITMVIADDLGDVRTDGFRLGQCVLNLLSNAAKFTQCGRIDVRVRREDALSGPMLHIDVADTGAGLDEEQIARLFQPFSQADPSITRKFGGTGLGLVITRRIAQSLGGDVAVESRKGAGSTFTLRIAAAPPAVEAESPIVRDGARTALVIDDDPAARDLVRRAFARRGIGVDLAIDGAAGVRAAAENRYDVIVLDINLPDINGWDLLASLKRNPETAHAAVIVMSVEDDRARSIALGAVAHFTKPADFDAMTTIALHFLDHSSAAA